MNERDALIGECAEGLEFAMTLEEWLEVLHRAGKARVLQEAFDELERQARVRKERADLMEAALAARIKEIERLRGDSKPRGDELAIALGEAMGRTCPWPVK